MGKRLDFLFFWDAARRDVFESISSLSGYFSTLSLNPPKKIIKEKTETSLFWWAFCIFVQKIFLWSSCEVLLSRSSYQLPKDWSIKLEKKVKRTKKILCQIIAYERPSLDDKHVFQLLGLLLLQANHSKNATLQVTFFPSSTYLSLVVVFRILCTFLAILFVKIKLKTKNQYLI